MKLYEISEEIQRILLESVDPETGAIAPEAWDALDALQMEREAKLEAIACAYKNLRSDAEELKAEEASLNERRKRKERRAESLKRFLERQLNGEKLETPRVLVAFRRVSAVNVNNQLLARTFLENGGYGNCLRYKEPEIDKNAVKRLLNVGVEVPGVNVLESLSMSVK